MNLKPKQYLIVSLLDLQFKGGTESLWTAADAVAISKYIQYMLSTYTYSDLHKNSPFP